MAIEQDLMGSIKCVGRLTQGRDITESTTGNWIACYIIVLKVCEGMKIFSSSNHVRSDQYEDGTNSRIPRDKSNL